MIKEAQKRLQHELFINLDVMKTKEESQIMSLHSVLTKKNIKEVRDNVN